MRPLAAVPTILAIALLVAACGSGGAAGPSAPTSAAPTAVATPDPTPAATAAPATPTPATPAPTPSGPVTFDSAAYGYRAVFPPNAGLVSAAPAATPWDGTTSIGSTGPYTDQFPMDGSRLMFVYGAPTDLPIAGYALEGQKLKNTWHGCPAEPETSTKVTFGGDPAVLNAFSCQGLRVLSLYVVHDGTGVVVNELFPPGDEAAEQQRFLDLVAGWSWLR